MTPRHGRRIAWTGLFLLVSASIVRAHPQHESWTEAEWNPETGMLEIAVRLDPGDLEATIRHRTGRELSLAEDAAEPVIEEYLRETLRFLSPQGRPVTWSWVGVEVTIPAAWLYLEVPLAGDPEGWTVVNTLLLHVPRQVNTMHIRHRDRKVTLRMTADRPSAPIAWFRAPKPVPLLRDGHSR